MSKKTTEAAAYNVREIVKLLADSLDLLLTSVNSEESSVDDVAELISITNTLGERARAFKALSDERVLEWLLLNKAGPNGTRLDEIVIGDQKYFGEKEKKIKCRDMPETGVAVASVVFGEHLLAALQGDETAYGSVMGGVREMFRLAVSSDGLKQGACREILGAGAVKALRMRLSAERREPTAAEIEAAERSGFSQFFEESWPDGLGVTDRARKLGVSNARFRWREGGGDKKYFAQKDSAAQGQGGLEIGEAVPS